MILCHDTSSPRAVNITQWSKMNLKYRHYYGFNIMVLISCNR